MNTNMKAKKSNLIQIEKKYYKRLIGFVRNGSFRDAKEKKSRHVFFTQGRTVQRQFSLRNENPQLIGPREIGSVVN